MKHELKVFLLCLHEYLGLQSDEPGDVRKGLNERELLGDLRVLHEANVDARLEVAKGAVDAVALRAESLVGQVCDGRDQSIDDGRLIDSVNRVVLHNK